MAETDVDEADAVVARRVGFLTRPLRALVNAPHLLVVLADSYGQVMLVRFLGGIPHGAFFGIGALVAASLVSHERRTAAIAAILGGLGVANVVGVPLATLIGQRYGWHAPYVVVGVIGLLPGIVLHPALDAAPTLTATSLVVVLLGAVAALAAPEPAVTQVRTPPLEVDDARAA